MSFVCIFFISIQPQKEALKTAQKLLKVQLHQWDYLCLEGAPIIYVLHNVHVYKGAF